MQYKVALVTYGMLRGGIETLLMNLATYLKNKGVQVTIITTEIEGAWFSKIEELGIRSKHISGLEKSFPFDHLRKVAHELRNEEYNAIFTTHARFGQACAPYLGRDTAIFPVILGGENIFYDITSYNSEYCNGIVSVSPRLELGIKERTNAQCPIKTILNGIEIIETTKYKLRTFAEKRLQLLYVGRLYHKEKGIFLLPEIVKIIHEKGIEVTLDIVGDGNDRDELMDKIQIMELTKNINMHGTVSSEQLYQSMCEAHFLLFPSFTEGLPLVPIEAQMCGCIPIASLIKGSTDCLIENGKTGELHEIGDYQGMAESIIKLWSQREVLQERSEQCIRSAREKFSVEAMGEAYYSLIVESAQGKYRPFKERKDIRILDSLNTKALLEKLSDILFIAKDTDTMELYKTWMEDSYINGRSLGNFLYNSGVKKTAIFGTFKTGLYIYNELCQANIKTRVFLDNNTEMQGKKFCGVEVCSPIWLINHPNEVDAVIVSIESGADIVVCKQLKELVPNHKIMIISWKELVCLNHCKER